MLWWALGMGGYIQIVFGGLLMMAAFARGNVRAPIGIGLFMGFLLWVLVSVIRVSGFQSWVAWGWRALLYAGALGVFLYVFNAPRERLPSASVVRALALFWVMVVLGGYLGIFFPHLSFTSVTERLLPAHILSNPFVSALVHPSTAGGKAFSGTSIQRPLAPFPYPNEWGAAFVVSLPFAVGALKVVHMLLARIILFGLLAASLVPLVFSFDRGAWLSTAATIVYVIVRLGLTRRGFATRFAWGLLMASVLVAVVVVLSPLGQLISLRLSRGYSDQNRLLLYTASVHLVLSSPWIGYGTPVARAVAGLSATDKASVGTHGQLWTILVSQGIPGLTLFLSWFVYSFVRTGRRLPVGSAGDEHIRFWANVAIFAALSEVVYYEWLPWGLFVLMAGLAVAWRETLVGPLGPNIRHGHGAYGLDAVAESAGSPQ